MAVAVIAEEYLIRACCLCRPDLHDNMSSWVSVSLIQLHSHGSARAWCQHTWLPLCLGGNRGQHAGLVPWHRVCAAQFFTLPSMQIWLMPISMPISQFQGLQDLNAMKNDLLILMVV